MGNDHKRKFSGNFAIYKIEREVVQEIASSAANIVWIHFRVLGSPSSRGDITALRFLLWLRPRESD